MIKILIVEDSCDKLRHIAEHITTLEYLDFNSIKSVSTSYEARQLLQTEYFDIAIIDIAIPSRIDLSVDREGGITLIRDIIERESFKTPPNIVCLTEYDDLFSQYNKLLGGYSIQAFKYSPLNDDFVPPLLALIDRVFKASNSTTTLRDDFKSDLALICALKTPELDQVLRNGWAWSEFKHKNDHVQFYTATVECNGTKRIVYAASALNMGMVSSTILATKMIEYFRPRFVAMTGIAAGISSKANLCDVVSPDVVWNWGSGKWTIRDDADKFLPDPYQHRTDFKMINLMKQFSTTSLFKNIPQSWPGDKVDTELSLHVGPIATGSCVVANKNVRDNIIAQHRSMIGLDMEIFAIYESVFQSSEPKPTALSFKSVVDFADASKNDSVQKYASFVSSSCLKLFFETQIWQK